MQRNPVHLEIVNDLDSNVFNWWSVVRDSPEALERWIELTPDSREAFEESQHLLANSDDPVVRAGAFSYVLTNSFLGSGGSFANTFSPSKRKTWDGLPLLVRPWAARLKNVRLEHMDALELLEGLKTKADAVIYCDPPYQSSTLPGYRTHGLPELDHSAMLDVLMSCQGKVALSGLENTSYDLPGWYKHTLNVRRFGPSSERRLEALWTNYPADNTLFN